MVFRQQTCVETRPLDGHGHGNCSFIVQFGGDGTWILVVVGGGLGLGGSEGVLWARPSGFSGLHGW